MRLEPCKPRTFDEHLLPADSSLAGLAALAHSFGVSAPLRTPSVISEHHVRGSVKTSGPWTIYDKRYEPRATVADLLTFALRHENLDLLILKRILLAIPEDVLAEYLRRHDEALRRIMTLVEMPDRLAEDVLMFILQNNGRLPNRRRQSDFASLTDQEVEALESIVNEAFEGFGSPLEH